MEKTLFILPEIMQKSFVKKTTEEQLKGAQKELREVLKLIDDLKDM